MTAILVRKISYSENSNTDTLCLLFFVFVWLLSFQFRTDMMIQAVQYENSLQFVIMLSVKQHFHVRGS